jgi:hypothetical protein
MPSINFYTPIGKALLGETQKIAPFKAPTRGGPLAPGAWEFGRRVVPQWLDALEKRKDKKSKAAILAALVGDKYEYDPSKAAESFTPSQYLETQRAALSDQAQAQPERVSALDLSPDDLYSPDILPPSQPDDLYSPDILKPEELIAQPPSPEIEALFGSDPTTSAAMQAALIATPEEELEAWAGSPEERAGQERTFMETVHSPDEEAKRMAELVASNPDIANSPGYQQWVMSHLGRKQALADEQRKHELDLELKRTGPKTAGAKPGTPYELNGRLVQDYIDESGNWVRRNLGEAPPHTYSARPGVALQYEEALTNLKAEIRAEEARDPNSSQLPILKERLVDLESTIAKSLDYIGGAAYAKTYEGARAGTAEDREKNMRGIRSGIQTKHDRLPILKNTAEEMKELSERWSTSGMIGSVAAKFNPGSDQYLLNAKMKTIQSAVGLEELISVKARGATFGALSDTEMTLLISSIEALDPNLAPEELGPILDNVMRLYEKGLNSAKKNFKELYPDVEYTWETEENVIKFDAQGNIIP